MSDTKKMYRVVTVRLELDQADRLEQFKLQRANSTGKWPSNQALIQEALDLLLVDIPRGAVEVDERQLPLFENSASL